MGSFAPSSLPQTPHTHPGEVNSTSTTLPAFCILIARALLLEFISLRYNRPSSAPGAVGAEITEKSKKVLLTHLLDTLSY